MKVLATKKLYAPYQFFLCIFVMLVIYAFFVEIHDLSRLFTGFYNILLSRSLLITDYIAVGGLGATLLNVALVGTSAVLLLYQSGAKPNGSSIMAICLSMGFAFFGKNLFNMIPITFGVWLYSKYAKDSFLNYTLVALLSATISPVVSEIAFLSVSSRAAGMLAGVLVGILCGFVFPPLSSYLVRVHDGYVLYNMGFAGGLLTMFVMSALKSVGIEIEMALHWDTGHKMELAMLSYLFAAAFIVFGCAMNTGDTAKNFSRINKSHGRLVSDYYILYGYSAFINMGILCAYGTTLVLLLGADLNGPTVGGILTMTGFGCFGKHTRNITPILIGAILSTRVNTWDPASPSNILAILFSTGLAPIAGQFGWLWGILAGFLHVNIVMHTSSLSNGMNLYNNGFAAGFVAMLLLPIINTFRRDK